jgi:hypothetical protein
MRGRRLLRGGGAALLLQREAVCGAHRCRANAYRCSSRAAPDAVRGVWRARLGGERSVCSVQATSAFFSS